MSTGILVPSSLVSLFTNKVWSITLLQYSALAWKSCSVYENVFSNFRCTFWPSLATVRSWLKRQSTIVALNSSGISLCLWSLLPPPLFYFPTLPPSIFTPLSCFLIVLALLETLSCALSIYAFLFHEMHLWAILENWLIIDWCVTLYIPLY